MQLTREQRDGAVAPLARSHQGLQGMPGREAGEGSAAAVGKGSSGAGASGCWGVALKKGSPERPCVPRGAVGSGRAVGTLFGQS